MNNINNATHYSRRVGHSVGESDDYYWNRRNSG